MYVISPKNNFFERVMQRLYSDLIILKKRCNNFLTKFRVAIANYSKHNLIKQLELS